MNDLFYHPNFRRMLLKVTIFIISAFFSLGLNAQDQKTILFFGDSITAGYGLTEEEAFPAVIQEKIDSLGLNYNVVNSGLSGETTAGGLRRIDWVLQQHVDLFVLELGGNDGLRGIDPESSKQNLQGIIDKVEDVYPNAKILLTGMEAPPNMGQTYTGRFREIYAELHSENDVEFMPFILETVAGDPKLNQPDGIHPTAEGHRLVADDLWEYLRPMLSGR
jgi:acyl-CoA thioesterase-1